MQELREKRERLLEIKAELAKPGGNFGVGIINTGKSYNKFATMPYEELRQIQKKENKFRKIIGMKPNKKLINNMETGYKPELDPRVLRAALKQKTAYYRGGQLNMVVVEGTNKLKEKAVEEAEKKNQELPPEALKVF